MASQAGSSSKESLQATVFQRLHPRTYLSRFVEEGFRPDGRELGDWRDISVNVGSISTANGSALVRMGDTTIVCGVKAEIAEPDLDAPEEGFIVPNIDLPALCSPKFKPGPPTDEAQVLSEHINDVLLSTDILPLSSLCIAKGKAAWVLYVDAICINYDGNAFDATLLAIVAALQNVKLPKAKYNEETGKTTCSRKELEPLHINRLPVSMTFGFFDSSHILSDPSSFEEPLLDSTLSVIVDEKQQLVSISQSGATGGTSTSNDSLLKCIATAKSRRDALSHFLRPQ
ncbi:hypothetical protein SCHPADRAFT_903189 [Schizopora paradoxa]|uniref:Ribosomal RNA-processing protein 43 n=1 Tax=Schizopora paradoxa TaxID=27342 RepID=A0A0H2RSF0_9AGAM|nr:hypothetical protein SCHPADRAFT_903189 [Schizopora paradoxa]